MSMFEGLAIYQAGYISLGYGTAFEALEKYTKLAEKGLTPEEICSTIGL